MTADIAKLKALAWEPYPNPALAGPDVAVADAIFGQRYQVQGDPDAAGFMAYLFPAIGGVGTLWWESKGYATLDDAKQAAQADFESRVLSALPSFLSRIEELEREQNKWNELVKAVRELRGYDETWPDHGNAPLAIAAGYALALRRAEAAEKRVAELEAALQKARNTLGGLGYAKIAQDICDDALGDQP